MKTVGIAAWIAVICFCEQTAFCSRITLEDNGYKGLLVAIHSSVPEDPRLVTNIKSLFTDASKFLYSATDGKVYFKEITIAVPSNWTWKQYYITQSGNHFAAANIQVDLPNPLYGDAPYTEQPGGCGEPGQYIHLTPRFVKEVDKMTEMFGMPGRLLVHEWAHLRYGVFDEYGIPGGRFPSFYIEHNKIRPTVCTGGIPGWIRSSKRENCCLEPNGQMNDDCIFVPDVTDTRETRASIMSTPFIASVDKFCDDGQNPARKHNTKAPTRQNAMCNYESTWSVISRHEDFRNLRTVVPKSLVPAFRVIQSPRRDRGHFVLLLDISHSMKGLPLTLLRQAATRLIEDRLPDGAKLGVVQFGGRAIVLHSLTTVSSANRQILSSNLPQKTISATAIGKGLLKSVEVLKEGSLAPPGGLIILVTDGEENVKPYIEDVAPEIVKEGIVVNTVAFGTKASEKLEKLTKTTGGKAYFFSDLNGKQSSAGLDSAFLESITVQSDIELQSQRLIDKKLDLDEPITQKTVIIDTDLGKDTVFTVTSPHIGQVDVSLRSPTGDIYNSESTEYSRDVNRRERIEVYLPRAQTGKWTISFTRHGGRTFPVTISIISKPMNSRQEPITVKAWLSNTEVVFPDQVKIFATVRKGYRAVVGATVTARVEGPHANTVQIILRDNGAGADVTANDGTYSGFFTQFNDDGRYAVTAEVFNDGKAKLKIDAKFSGSPAIPTAKGPFDEKPATEFPLSGLKMCKKGQQPTGGYDDNTGDPAEQFQREADGGSFRVEKWDPNAGDVTPPGDIRDLEILHSDEDYETRTAEITLRWTSVGDDLDFGNVASNELWIGTNYENFLKDPASGFRVPEKNVTKGSLRPIPPGRRQNATVLVSFSDNTETLYFAVRGKDEEDNVSLRYSVAPLYISAKKEISKKNSHFKIVKALLIFEDI